MALDLLKWTHVIPAAQKRPGPFGAWLLAQAAGPAARDRSDAPGRAWGAETGVVASRFTSWEACQECAESQVAVPRGAPLTQAPRPYAARDAARWTIGILDCGVMNSPHW